MSIPPITASVPSLSDWQVYYNGLIMGVGTSYAIEQLTGLAGPKFRNQDQPRARDLGSFLGFDTYGSRTFGLDLIIVADGTNSLQQLMLNVAQAFSVQPSQELPFSFKLPTLPQMVIMARPKRREYPINMSYSVNFVGKPTIELEATDPNIYGTPTQSVSTGLSTPPSGTNFNITFPMTFGGGTLNYLLVNNSGNTNVRPIIVFTGPLTNPYINNSSIAGNPKLSFTNPTQTGYTLNAGDTLTVDTDAHTIVYTPSGSTSGSDYRSWLVFGSTWFDLQVGANNLYFGSGDISFTSGTVAVYWANGYQM